MLIAVSLVVLAFVFVFALKIFNKVKNRIIQRRERQMRLLTYQNEYYSHNTNSRLLDEEAQKNRYSIQVLQKNICKIFGYYVQKKMKLFLLTSASFVAALIIVIIITTIRFKMIEERIKRFFDKSSKEKPLEYIDKDSSAANFTTFFNWDLCKMANEQFLEDYFMILFSLSLTMFIYFWNSFRIKRSHKYFCRFSKQNARKCRSKNNSQNMPNDDSDDETGANRTFLDSFETNANSAKITKAKKAETKESNCCYRLIDWYINFKRWLNLSRFKRFVACGMDCSCGMDFPVPMNPFSKRNRFITGVIYAAYTYNILKIFEHLMIGGDQAHKILDHTKSVIKGVNATNFTSLVNTNLSSLVKDSYKDISEFAKQQERGILMDLLKQICNVFIIGLRYYPVLLCAEVKRKSKLCYLLCTIYVAAIFAYYLYMNTFCLLSAYTTIKDFQSTIKMGDTNANK
jgi:hypothetical protein